MERAELSNAPKTPEQLPGLFKAFPETEDTFLTEEPAYWSPYKTAAEKLKYENDLPTVIQPFMRAYFQRHANEMAEVQRHPLEDYTGNLKEAWNKHLAANKLVDRFLSYETNSPFGQWSPAEWKSAKLLLRAAMETDHEKAMYSAGLKTKLETESKRLIARYGSQIDGFETLLLTPSFPTFYEKRDLDQKKYLLSVTEGHPDDALKEEIINIYHGGDANVFELRMAEETSAQDIEKLRTEIQTSDQSFRDRAVKKGYVMAERPDVKAFDELLKFDNTQEYEYTYSLKGLPDLYLREEILRRLVTLDKLPANSSVFGLTLDQFNEAIHAVLTDQEHEFTTVLRPYRQNYDTCGTACVMSILNRKGMRMDEDAELRIWEMVGKPYNFPGGLAWVLLRNGFEVTYVQDKPELLDKNNPEFAKMNSALVDAAKTYVDLHEKAVEQGLEFKVSDWGYDRVRSEIMHGNVCLLYLHVNETMSHVVIANGVKDGKIQIIDPLGSIRSMTQEELDRRIVNPMGKRLLVVKKLPSDLLSRTNEDLAELGYTD